MTKILDIVERDILEGEEYRGRRYDTKQFHFLPGQEIPSFQEYIDQGYSKVESTHSETGITTVVLNQSYLFSKKLLDIIDLEVKCQKSQEKVKSLIDAHYDGEKAKEKEDRYKETIKELNRKIEGLEYRLSMRSYTQYHEPTYGVQQRRGWFQRLFG